MPPFTFHFGMYTAYPLYSADGGALQVFPCMAALDRWTELQIKSISVEMTFSRNLGACEGVVRKGATDIQNFDLATDVEYGLSQSSFAEGKPYCLATYNAYDPKGWIRAANPAQNVYFTVAANGSDAILLNAEIPHPGFTVMFDARGAVQGYQANHCDGLLSLTVNFEVWCRNPRTNNLRTRIDLDKALMTSE